VRVLTQREPQRRIPAQVFPGAELGRESRGPEPALLAIFGRAAFWPSNTAPGTPRPGWWGRTAGRIVSRPAATLALGVLCFQRAVLARQEMDQSGYRGAGNHGHTEHVPITDE
jgi:hypothetical protein